MNKQVAPPVGSSVWVLTLAFSLFSVAHSQCLKYTCQDLKSNNITAGGAFCVYQPAFNPGEIFVDKDVCNSTTTDERKYCVALNVNGLMGEEASKLKGTCTAVSKLPKLGYEIKLPGERCDAGQFLSKCAYGKRRCLNERCLGFYEGEECADSKDCNPVLYCNAGKCSQFKKEGEPCKFDEECGRDKMCYTGGPGSKASGMPGLCKPFFSLEDGQKVDIESTIFNHLLCKSGYANDRSITQSEEYGKCGSKIIGFNSGEECSSSSNCPTNDLVVNSNCLCTPNSGGKSFCTFEKGGSEWIEVVDSVDDI